MTAFDLSSSEVIELVFDHDAADINNEVRTHNHTITLAHFTSEQSFIIVEEDGEGVVSVDSVEPNKAAEEMSLALFEVTSHEAAER